MSVRIIVLAIIAIGSTAMLADEKLSKVAPSPAYEKMKTLVGSWDGTVNEGSKQLTTHARVKLFSDGSALAHWLDEDTPHEMVTMFHMDGNHLMATHYCAAHNQPRTVLLSGRDANRIVFKFKDGTNIQPDAGHMQQVAFVFDGPDHHFEEWTYLQDGKENTTRFDFEGSRNAAFPSGSLDGCEPCCWLASKISLARGLRVG
jgi:hypothetical protein